jgi:hypothetical protein
MRRILKNFVAKIFGIRQCACPPEEATTKTTVDVPESNTVGHCNKHDTYRYSCLDCNTAMRIKK